MSGLALFAFSGGFSVAAMNTGLALMLLGFLLQARQALPTLLRDPLALLVTAFCAYVVLRGLLAVYSSTPADPDRGHLGQSWHLLRADGLLAVAGGWWLFRHPAWIRRCLNLAVLSGLVGLAVALTRAPRLPWEGLVRLKTSASPNAFGLYAALVLLVLCMRPPVRCGTRARRIMLMAGWGAALIVALLALLWSGSRSAWLGAMIGIPVTLAVQWGPTLCRWLATPAGRRPAAAAALLAVLALGGIVATSDTVAWRLDPGEAVRSVRDIAAGDWQAVPNRSLRYRLMLWRSGATIIRNAPWLGWGPAGAQPAIKRYAASEVKRFPHLHNMVLNLWAQLGLVGVGLFGVCGIVALFRGLRPPAGSDVPDNLVRLAGGGLLTFFLIGQLQIRYLDPTGIVPNSLFLAILIATGLRARATGHRDTPGHTP
ncbi:O-antigen ligase family protein [Arhodomonas sp. KWT2]|uniref:O-antigen ligase family protein n=1 Tax=unclassified Arhodomonas TaxID=2621637 RepID=UPI001969E503|nr:O-antigen ligase family protein [Arhodomonas sp. KWT]